MSFLGNINIRKASARFYNVNTFLVLIPTFTIVVYYITR